MSEKPNILVRAWRSVTGFVGALFGPDKAADHRTTRLGPVQEQQARAFRGGSSG